MPAATFESCVYTNRADFTAVASTASETGLMIGGNVQPVIPATLIDATGFGKAFRITARGTLVTTGTPTVIFRIYLNSTQGFTQTGGTVVARTAAMTTASGIATPTLWEAKADLIVSTPGHGTGACTVNTSGVFLSPAGFASVAYPLTPAGGESGTWTSTFDAAVAQWINLTWTWSASSASNSATLKQVLFESLN